MGKSKNIHSSNKRKGTPPVYWQYTRGPPKKQWKRKQKNPPALIYTKPSPKINQRAKSIHNVQVCPRPKIEKKR